MPTWTPSRAASLAVALAAAGLSGCMVGPDYVAPAAPATAGFLRGTLSSPGGAGRRDAGAQRFAVGQDVPAEWWRSFRSRPLATLVDASLAANPNMEAALAAIRAARESAEAERGALFPQIGFGLAASRQRASGGGLSSPLANNALSYALFTPQFTASVTPDVFGGIARRIESAGAQADVQRFQYEAAVLNLTTGVVAAAIQEASLRGQIEAARRVIGLQRDHLRLIGKQQQLGQATGADIAQQEAAIAASEGLLPPLEKQLAQQRNLLTALAGRFPADEVAQRFTLGSLGLPATVPVSLPGALVRQRPDVRAAEAALRAASADVGVAVANRFPQITLTANAGLSATGVAGLFGPGAQFYSLGAGLLQPIIDGGTLFHRQKAAEATLAQVDAQYRAAVIAAFQNVADALRALQADARAVRATRASVEANARSVEFTRKQLEEGAADNTALILAQQLYLQALTADVQAQATRLADTVALFQALGGGWWNRPEPVIPIESGLL